MYGRLLESYPPELFEKFRKFNAEAAEKGNAMLLRRGEAFRVG